MFKAFVHDRSEPGGKIFSAPLEQIESILREFTSHKERASIANDYGALVMIYEKEITFSQILIRIRNRTDNFVRSIEIAHFAPPDNSDSIEKKCDPRIDEISNLKNFLQANLRRAVFRIPEREIDVQNTVEQLLIGRGLVKGVDYDRETGRVKISAREVVPDFIFPALNLALEVKLSKDKDKSKAIIDEINADIRAYGKNYAFTVFLIYDLGAIRDDMEFKQDLETPDSVSVLIVKH